MKENRLKFAISHKEWTHEDWKRVLWSDEAPQTDRMIVYGLEIRIK